MKAIILSIVFFIDLCFSKKNAKFQGKAAIGVVIVTCVYCSVSCNWNNFLNSLFIEPYN